MPPTVLVLVAVSSVQVGAALAKTLFDEIGVGGTVFLRMAAAALVLALVWRPRLRGHSSRELRLVVVFALALAGMNLAFYSSIDRIPLGIAVTFEFVGPLGVAVFGSRKPLDLLWVALAAAGILLLSDFGSGDLDRLGVGLALLAGAFWAAYILLSVRVGQAFPGGSGLALAMVVATVPLAPVGIAEAGSELLVPSILLAAAGVGILSSAFPYALELEALRRMPAGVFGVLMSLEPGVAALAGYVLLGEALVTREIAAIVLVVAASAGAARRATVALRDA
ncbi:MAG TPA: EamA family transporter [Thermoleophilaceae bacterium]|nr:EamA family transporter [Thermoleophilaceae bacterium]